MSQYLVSVVESIRVANVNEVENLHNALKNDNHFELKKFEYAHKEVKSKGEVIDEYELVKATLIFNNEKEPTCAVKIDFNVDPGFFPEPVDSDEDEAGGIEF